MPVIQEYAKTVGFTDHGSAPTIDVDIETHNLMGLSLEARVSIRLADNGHANSASQDKFERLSSAWKRQTRHVSFSHQKINSTYLKIIGMGEKAVPLILRDLLSNPNPYWFVALNAIASQDDNLLPTGANVEEIQQAWLAWGRSKGLI
jgi:hypothetical protein